MHGGHGNIPELLVGLSYNATTGRLGVEIIKGSHFKHLSGGRAPGERWQENIYDQEKSNM